MCLKETIIKNMPDKNINLNTESVLGCQTMGIGYLQLQELFGIYGIKIMAESTWQVYSGDTYKYINKALQEELAKAADEDWHSKRVML